MGKPAATLIDDIEVEIKKGMVHFCVTIGTNTTRHVMPIGALRLLERQTRKAFAEWEGKRGEVVRIKGIG